jgi:hypothetical protein
MDNIYRLFGDNTPRDAASLDGVEWPPTFFEATIYDSKVGIFVIRNGVIIIAYQQYILIN